MSGRSKLEWDWDNDAPLSSVGGQVFLKELSREEVETRQAVLRSKFRSGVDAVKVANETLAHSDHRGQDALRHFKTGVHVVEMANATLAKSDGRGQRAIRHLKAAKDAVLMTNMNQNRYHKHHKDFQTGHGAAAAGMFEQHQDDGGDGRKGEEEGEDSMWEHAQDSVSARNRYQIKESETPPEDGDEKGLEAEYDLGEAHRLGMEVPILDQEPEHMSNAKHHLRAAVEAVRFSNNYTRRYPDVAATDQAGRVAMLRKRYEELQAQKDENKVAKIELQALHEEQRKELITSENASAEKLGDLHDEQKQEKDLLAAFHNASEKETEQEISEVNVLHQQLIEHEEKKEGTTTTAGNSKGREPTSSSSITSSKKSRGALMLGLMDEILTEEGEANLSGEDEFHPVNPFSDLGSKRSASEKTRKENVKAVIKSARAQQQQQSRVASAGTMPGEELYADRGMMPEAGDYNYSARSGRSVGSGLPSGPGTGLSAPPPSFGVGQADPVANAQALLVAHRQGGGTLGTMSPGADGMQLQLMLSNLLALQNQQSQLQQQLNGRKDDASQREESSFSKGADERHLPHPPRGTKGSSSSRRYNNNTGDESRAERERRDDEDSISVLSEGSAKPMLPEESGVSADLEIAEGGDSLSPIQREMREAASLPSKLHHLGGISEAHAGRPKLLLDNMQTQAHTFVREINVIKIQRVARAFLARLYVDYIRAERKVRENCVMETMYDVMNEVNITSSVQVALDEYSDVTKADLKETSLVYEIKKVVDFMLSETIDEEATEMVSHGIKELVTAYQRQKHASESSNPLVQLVTILLDDVLDDRNNLMMKLRDPLDTGVPTIAVDGDAGNALRRKVEGISKSLLLEVVRESIKESVQDHLLNTRALEVFDMLLIETVEDEKRYPVVPCLNPSFGVEMIATQNKHSEMLMRERKKRKATRQARLERNAAVRRNKAAAYQVLERQKKAGLEKGKKDADDQPRKKSDVTAATVDEETARRRNARKERRDLMTEEQLARLRAVRQKWKAKNALNKASVEEKADGASKVSMSTKSDTASAQEEEKADAASKASTTTKSHEAPDKAGEEKDSKTDPKEEGSDKDSGSVEKILHEDLKADETESGDASKQTSEGKSEMLVESSLHRSESVTSDLTADTNNITGVTPSKTGELDPEKKSENGATPDAASRMPDVESKGKSTPPPLSNAGDSKIEEEIEDDDVQSHSSVFDTSDSEGEEESSGRRGSEDESVALSAVDAPVTFNFAEQEQVIEALNAEEEPVSDEHDSDEEEMQLLALIRATSSPRAMYGRQGDGEFNDLPIPIPGPITKDLYLAVGQVSEEALIIELTENICESLLTEYTENRVASFSRHVLDSIEKEFYLEKELIDKERVRAVARGAIGKNLVLKRLLHHISDNFNNLLLEHFFRGIITREISKRCAGMLLTAEQQQIRLLVAACPYSPDRALKFLQVSISREKRRKTAEAKELAEPEVEVSVASLPQVKEEKLEPLRIGDLETSTTPLKKLLFKAVVPPVVESVLTSFKNANNTLLDDIDMCESYSRGHTISGTTESLYIKGGSGKVVTKHFYDFSADSEAISIALSAQLTESLLKAADPTMVENAASAANTLGVNVDDGHANMVGEARGSGRPGTKINVTDVLARLKRKRKVKMEARYGSTQRAGKGAVDANGKDALVVRGAGNVGKEDAKLKLLNPLVSQKSGAYQDSDSFSSFGRKFRHFRDQQYVTYAKAMEDSKNKIQENKETLLRIDSSAASSLVSKVTEKSTEERMPHSTGSEESNKPEDVDPSLKLLRLNPHRWYRDEQESRYFLPPTSEELEAFKAHEEQQRLQMLANKEREQKIKAEQEKLMEQNRQLLKKRTAYLWKKLRDHAVVVGKMAKASNLDVKHAPVLTHSDSESTISTVSLETKQARDKLLADLLLQKDLMKDITTFETDDNKIIVIQKRSPRQKFQAAQDAVRATLAMSSHSRR